MASGSASDPESLMRYVLITPARNEAANIERTIQCVTAQTHLPLRWLIVNDGSTDETAALVRKHLQLHPWMELIEMPHHRDRSFAAKAHCFNAGWKHLKGVDYDVIGNLDADLSFGTDYFEFLTMKFSADPALGVTGTVFREEGYSSETHSYEGEQHVAGGAQLFRRQCFEDVGGYVPNKAGGVDWIAVTTARMLGWRTRSYREKWFDHHRRLGTAERGRLASAFSYGEKDYYLGNAPIWQAFRIAYRMAHRPYFLAGAALGLGYLSAIVRRIDRPVSAELMAFHRREQREKLKAILRAAIRFKSYDRFEATSR